MITSVPQSDTLVFVLINPYQYDDGSSSVIADFMSEDGYIINQIITDSNRQAACPNKYLIQVLDECITATIDLFPKWFVCPC